MIVIQHVTVRMYTLRKFGCLLEGTRIRSGFLSFSLIQTPKKYEQSGFISFCLIQTAKKYEHSGFLSFCLIQTSKKYEHSGFNGSFEEKKETF